MLRFPFICPFRDWPEEQVSQLASVLQYRRYPPQTKVVTQGGPADSIFFVKSGEVRVVRRMVPPKLLRATLKAAGTPLTARLAYDPTAGRK